jgi:hypothetical protein
VHRACFILRGNAKQGDSGNVLFRNNRIPTFRVAF